MQPTVPQSAGAADMDLPAVQSMDWLFKKERIYLLAQFWQQVIIPKNKTKQKIFQRLCLHPTRRKKLILPLSRNYQINVCMCKQREKQKEEEIKCEVWNSVWMNCVVKNVKVLIDQKKTKEKAINEIVVNWLKNEKLAEKNASHTNHKNELSFWKSLFFLIFPTNHGKRQDKKNKAATQRAILTQWKWSKWPSIRLASTVDGEWVCVSFYWWKNFGGIKWFSLFCVFRLAVNQSLRAQIANMCVDAWHFQKLAAIISHWFHFDSAINTFFLFVVRFIESVHFFSPFVRSFLF